MDLCRWAALASRQRAVDDRYSRPYTTVGRDPGYPGEIAMRHALALVLFAFLPVSPLERRDVCVHARQSGKSLRQCPAHG